MQITKPETIASGILDTALGAWADHDATRTPTGMITLGTPPLDGPDLLFVSVLGITGALLANPRQRPQSQGGTIAPSIRLTVTLTRAWPSWTNATPELRAAEDDATRQVLRDGAILHGALVDGWKAGTLIDGYPERTTVIQWGELSTLPPSGTVCGWTWPFTVDATARE